MTGSDDQLLLSRIQQRDPAALAEFYDRYSSLLYSLAYRVLNQQQEAEDVLQEALLLLWNKASAYSPQLGQPLTWAITLTRNKAIDRLRARQRRFKVLVEENEEMPEAAETAETPAHAVLDAREAAAVVQEALRTLPAEQRHPIELAFFSGLSHSEIAERLDEPLGTIKARIRRGMLKLREPLERLRAA